MIQVINPATEAILAELEEDRPESIHEKFLRARAAQKAWAGTALGERIKILQAFRDLLNDQKEKLAALLTKEMGKPITQSRNELTALLGRIQFFTEHTERTLGTEVVLRDPAHHLEERITQEPLGVIGNISAWNYPYFVGSNVFVPALLTGNAVLYKPSEWATLTGQAISNLLHEAGVPSDVFILVIGKGSVGADLVNQPLNGIFFTGSYATGKKIVEGAARRLMKCQLELGGKDPVYVRDDVDVEAAAAAIADGAFYNTGQSCCSVERVYIHRGVYGAFVEAFLNTVKGFPVGDPLDEGTYIGPLTRGAHLDFLENQVNDARVKGARVLCGGQRLRGRPGYFFEPTVLLDVNHSMSVMREETFGPLIGLQSVSSDLEAVDRMNDTEYGLTAGVYTKDLERAQWILSRTNAGSAYWNCCDRVSPRLPWSGRGHSGMGTTLSTYGIQAFLQPKAWHMRAKT